MAEKIAKAQIKHARVPSSKARRYINLIKGKPYNEAVAILKFMPSPTAKLVQKVLESAGANAEENHDMVKDSLYVKDGLADQGVTMKRMMARAMGRGMRIRKRMSHITIILSEKPVKS